MESAGELTRAVMPGLTLLLVLALLVELALSPIFGWRRGPNRKNSIHPVTFVFTALLLWHYRIDPIQLVMEAFMQGVDSALGSQLLGVVSVAAGSRGIFLLFRRLGLQDSEQKSSTTE